MNRKKIVAIVQARTGSTRLAGKQLADVGGLALLDLVIARVRQAETIDRIWLAVPANDSILIERAAEVDGIFAGDEQDVLGRFYEAAVACDADIIIRVTADDPLKDPSLIDTGVRILFNTETHFCANTQAPTFPLGLDTEVFTMDLLKRANIYAPPSMREHVTTYMIMTEETSGFWTNPNLHDWRWTIDYQSDLEWFNDLSRWIDLRTAKWTAVRDYLFAHPKCIRTSSDVKELLTNPAS